MNRESELAPARSLLSQTAIAGTYVTKQGRLNESSEELWVESALGAIADANLDVAEVDGIAGLRSPSYSASQAFPGLWAEILGHPVRFYTGVDAAAAAHCAVLLHASLAVGAGLANAIVVLGGGSKGGKDRDKHVKELASFHGEFDTAWGSIVPSWFALIARRHMYEFGTTSEQLAEIAVSTRHWASLNPDAIMRDRIGIEDVLGSRMISDPLHLLDCCLVNDGAGAVVITRRDRLEGSERPIVRLLGGAEEYTRRGYQEVSHDMMTSGAVFTGRRALEMADVSIDDIDIAELYDCFTITVLRELEDLGFCKPGEGGDFVEGQALAPGGRLPTNTHGGGLSWGHSFSGLSHAIEATRQLYGEAGARQVVNPKIALVHSQGGPLAMHSTAVIGVD